MLKNTIYGLKIKKPSLDMRSAYLGTTFKYFNFKMQIPNSVVFKKIVSYIDLARDIYKTEGY